MAFSGTQKTRMAHNGTYTRLTGSFAGKTEEGAPTGRIMSSLVQHGGLASKGGIAGKGGGLAG